MSDDEEDPQSPGWNAITRALRNLYGDREPQHWGTIKPSYLGGPDPLDGVSAYKNLQPVPHWHFISYGLSELYGKESPNPDISGFGYEFTFRLACDPAEEKSPVWAVNLMQNIARCVLDGSVFGPFHTIDCNGPIHAGAKTALSAILFVQDPQLGEQNTLNGKMHFLQLVGITADELAAKNAWNAQEIVRLLALDNPLLITDPARKSLLETPLAAQLINEGIARDGSSCDQLRIDQLTWHTALLTRRITISLPAATANSICRLLSGRILHNKPFLLVGPETTISFEPAAESSCRPGNEGLIVALNPAAVKELLQKLVPKAGEFDLELVPKLRFRINRTEIRDKDGKVTDVIG